MLCIVHWFISMPPLVFLLGEIFASFARLGA
jgi:hypothetical protein